MKRMMPLGSLAILLTLFLVGGCGDDATTEIPGGGQATDMSCLGCHSSEEMLQASLAGEAGSKVAVAIKSDG